jgi:DNA polymerase-4
VEVNTVRTILHVDMDMFFVAVELLRRPELRGRPVVVGGSGSRGVVAAASYEARRYGVHSAMPSARARALCPGAVFLPGDMDTYVQYSARVFAIFEDFTPLVEGLSVDEAFLDVSGASSLYGNGVEIASMIRARVRDEIGLSCSVGVATNKFVAKLASEQAKPIATADGVAEGRGIVEIAPGSEVAFVRGLPVSALWGVGPATLAKLERMGVSTVADLAALDGPVLAHAVGTAHAAHLLDLANAADSRPVNPHHESRSLGNEETFARDIADRDELRVHLVRLVESVMKRARAESLTARTVTLKIKFPDFRTMTRSKTVDHGLTTAQSVVALVTDLLDLVDVGDGVRLLGVSLRNFTTGGEQLQLFGTGDAETLEEAWTPATETVDEIRRRFGDDSITVASTLATGRPAGSSPWGPDESPGDEASRDGRPGA